MHRVRPVEAADIPALEALAHSATIGVHTLPRSRAAIEQVVAQSLASFAEDIDMPGEESYFFVLEDLADGAIAGAAAINATAGAAGTFFAFRNDVIQQVSRDLNISHSVHALTLCSDLSSYSQLSSFFVRDASHRAHEARLLSRARLMFAAAAPQRFADHFIASLAGLTDVAGRSPFWEALGRKFFGMDFLEAERTIGGARNRSLIVELMPHYPVYVSLLPGEAQAAMGQVHEEGELPFELLTGEGFLPDEFIDIFDGGPILQAHRSGLRSIAGAMRRSVQAGPADDAPLNESGRLETYLVSTAGAQSFRAVLADCPSPVLSQSVVLPRAAMAALEIAAGDTVLCVKL